MAQQFEPLTGRDDRTVVCQVDLANLPPQVAVKERDLSQTVEITKKGIVMYGQDRGTLRS